MDSKHPVVFERQVFQDADLVFSTSDETVEVMTRQSNSGHQELQQVRFTNSIDLQRDATANSSREQHSLYIISRNTSWSCLNVSLSSFHHIFQAHKFCDNVYDVVHAFRRRRKDIQQFRWSACRTHLHSPEHDQYEICYRIQYPVRNNRNRGDPFSIRQTGVCQKNHGPQNSTWIILQPSLEILDRLKLITSKPDFMTIYEEDPMSLHLIFLEFQTVNWDDYIEELRISLEPLIDAAHYSRVGRSCKYPLSDYSVEFEQCQNLQKFQWKLAQVLPAVEGNIAVLKTCEDRWLNHTGPRVQASIVDVRGFVKQLEFHKGCVQHLATQAQRSAKLLHKILDYRVSKEIQKSNTNMYNILGTLDSQAKGLTLLSEQRQKDSRTIKALTSIATFYLPASLVATVFSSDLVQLLPTTPSQKPSHFVAAPQMWLPIMVTLSLMAVTLASTQLLERLYRYFK